ncbi:MAG: hypothetical protein HND48_09040 [Chloroflexi bacterium]|nr:hypothetical protein [Chloroflexota bacterium]
MLKRVLTIVALIGVLAVGMTAHAGDTVLTNNTGTASTIWFISGEASLVINGFDLTSRSIQTSVLVDRISISVRTPRPGVPVEAVIYEDADGGSPRNAALLARKTVTIDTAGVFNVDFDPAIEVKRPFLWVGFYLPVDFEFRADTQGKLGADLLGLDAGRYVRPCQPCERRCVRPVRWQRAGQYHHERSRSHHGGDRHRWLNCYDHPRHDLWHPSDRRRSQHRLVGDGAVSGVLERHV